MTTDYSAIYYQCIRTIEMARLGYRLANERLSVEDARSISYEAMLIAGEFPLVELSVEDVIEQATDRWPNSEETIHKYAFSACRAVWGKWSSDGEDRSAAEDWALDKIMEWATDDGVTLTEESALSQ
jgi:hypothetical protein